MPSPNFSVSGSISPGSKSISPQLQKQIQTLLDREMTDRAFVYSERISREEWSRRRAGEVMAGFLSGPEESRHLLLSCLVDAVGTHDAMLLDELEKKIQQKREELAGNKR